MSKLKDKLNDLFVTPTDNIFLQMFRYAFVGGIAFVADWGSLYVIEKLGVHYLVAAIFAFVIGLTVNFLLSIAFVFSKQKARVGRAAEFAVYAVIGVIGLGLTEAIMYVCTDLLGLWFMISKIIAAAIVLFWNFIARKLILYREKK